MRDLAAAGVMRPRAASDTPPGPRVTFLPQAVQPLRDLVATTVMGSNQPLRDLLATTVMGSWVATETASPRGVPLLLDMEGGVLPHVLPSLGVTVLTMFVAIHENVDSALGVLVLGGDLDGEGLAVIGLHFDRLARGVFLAGDEVHRSTVGRRSATEHHAPGSLGSRAFSLAPHVLLHAFLEPSTDLGAETFTHLSLESAHALGASAPLASGLLVLSMAGALAVAVAGTAVGVVIRAEECVPLAPVGEPFQEHFGEAAVSGDFEDFALFDLVVVFIPVAVFVDVDMKLEHLLERPEKLRHLLAREVGKVERGAVEMNGLLLAVLQDLDDDLRVIRVDPGGFILRLLLDPNHVGLHFRFLRLGVRGVLSGGDSAHADEQDSGQGSLQRAHHGVSSPFRLMWGPGPSFRQGHPVVRFPLGNPPLGFSRSGRTECHMSLDDSETALIQRLRGWAPEMRAFLERLVAQNSHTPHVEGVNAVGRMMERQLLTMGFKAGAFVTGCGGQHLIARREGDDGHRLLLVGHLDTVHPPREEAPDALTEREGRLFGPGAADMKGGLVVMASALKALDVEGLLEGRAVTVLLTADEELGSPTAHDLVVQEGRDHHLGLVFEAGRPCSSGATSFVTRRKGFSRWSLRIEGVEAHSGVAKEKGLSAALEMAHKIIALEALNDPSNGVSVNVGIAESGTAVNTVPGQARLEIDARFPSPEAGATLEAALRKVLGVPQTGRGERRPVLHVKEGPRMEPMVETEAMARMAGRIRTWGGELGLKLEEEGRGGGSDANLLAEAGCPVVDGLGVVGGDFHSPEEWVDPASLLDRSCLAALVMKRFFEL
ncbi:MAG TPA: M20 family peptidase [Planctomycetes bacterium]|nr:M20 family peptidase [Planctomycetota bacterium]